MTVYVLIGLALKAKGRADRTVSAASGGGGTALQTTTTLTTSTTLVTQG
jgi:hypothetical protein